MIVFLFLVITLTWFITFRYRRRHLYKLAGLFPKPERELPMIGIAHTLSGSMEDVMVTLQKSSYEAMKNDGTLRFWLGPLLYFLSVDPADLEVILKTCLEKDYVYGFMGQALGNGVVTAPVSIWRRHRRIINRAFNSKIVESFAEGLSEKSDKFAELLSTNIGKFRILPLLNSYTFDSVCDFFMNVKINSQKDPDSRLLKIFRTVQELVSERISHIWLHPDWIYRMSLKLSEFNKQLQLGNDFFYGVIKKNREEIKTKEGCKFKENDNHDVSSLKTKNFIEMLATISDGDEGLTDVEIRDELITLATAGSDSTAATIGFTLTLLGQYPDVQEKLYQELRDVFGDSDRLLVNDDLKQLKYLDRVVKESMRLFPPSPVIIRKVTQDTKLPSGRVLPAGSSVVISIWGAHRDPKYWGPDADNFDPDRFLPERFNLTHPCSYMPFSFGPRNCVGFQYALLSTKILLSTVLKRYRVVGEKETNPAPHMRVKFDLIMKDVNQFEIELEKRK